jgi:hypothetical protein
MQRPRRTALAGLAAALLLLVAFAVLRIVRPTAPRPSPAPAPAAVPPPGPERAGAPLARPPAGLPIRVPPVVADATPDTGPGTFEGRVVSSRTGAGIAGADLTFSRGGAAALARTGAEGAFRFIPPGEGRWLLAAVTAPGFFPFAPEWGHSPVQLEAAAGRHFTGLEIHLAPAEELTGRVVDAADAPVAGAAVRVLGAVAEAALVPFPDRFVSGPDGRFRFAAPEGAVLEARKDGFLPGRTELSPLELAAGEVVIALGPPRRGTPARGAIAGRVLATPGGAPVAGALVVAERERGFMPDVPSAQAVTGGDGAFSLPDLDAGRYRLSARADGRAPATARRVETFRADVVLELGAGGRLRGCVRDAASGAPVAPFTVMLFERRSPLWLEPLRSRSVIDPRGCYALDDLAPGPAVMIVSAPGFAPSSEQTVEIPSPPGEAVADAALAAGGRLTGVVRDDATGAAIGGARLSAEGAFAGAASTFPVLAEAVTADDGTFTLGSLPRRAAVLVVAAGHHGRIVSGIEAPSGGVAGPIEFRLRPAAEGEELHVDLAGIGAVLVALGDGLAVRQVVAGGGAAEAGLTRGDVILEVDGRPVSDLGMTGAIDAIRGPEGTTVVLQLRRGERTFEARVPRRLVRG